jgi:hypothetical protein
MAAEPARNRATVVRAVAAAVVLLLVVVGAASSGFSGALIMAGLAVFLLGLGALLVGRARWALIASRAVGGVVAAVGVVALIAGGLAAPDTAPAAATSSPASTSRAAASSSAADAEAATVAAEASLLQAESNEGETSPKAVISATGLLSDSDADAAIVSAGQTTALAALAVVTVQGRAPKTGYSRDAFGSGWVDTDHNGCDTRNDVLSRDLIDDTFKPGTHNCVVLSGSLADPYSGRAIAFQRGQGTSNTVQIDHVVALSNSWQTGAQGWDAARRTAFANDQLNLLAVDGSLNMQKGDGDAATWLPPNKGYRCAYVARQVAVKVSYGLWMTQAEHNAIATILSGCPDETLPGGVVANVPTRTTAAASTSAPAPAPAPRSTAAPQRAPVVVPVPAPAPAPVPEPEPEPDAGVYFANCTAAKAAGAAPLYAGQPGYRDGLDRDHDGVACET